MQEELPKILYKAFNKRAYAESFLDGNVRMCTLEAYKNMENNPRQDKSEGQAQYTIPNTGPRQSIRLESGLVITESEDVRIVHQSRTDQHFIYCFSNPKSNKLENLPTKFGKYIVKINNPKKFVKDLKRSIKQIESYKINPPTLEHGDVSYTKYLALSKRDKSLAWRQKPESYSDEMEFRLALWLSLLEKQPEPLIIKTKSLRGHSELIVRRSMLIDKIFKKVKYLF
ncbi:TPA: hypothetical protein ACP5S6_004612 [Vibrio parahaemolyticus]